MQWRLRMSRTLQHPAPDSAPATPASPAWAAVVVASRESVPTLMATLDALARAAVRPLLIDLVINGNDALAHQAAAAVRSRPPHWPAEMQLRIWSLAFGDKAHALNRYVHDLWPGGEATFFVDGYVRVRPDALKRLASTLARLEPEAMAVAAFPTCGRGASVLAANLHRHGGLHGNLFVLGAPAMRAMREIHFQLPLGMYRVDSTLAAALAFRLFPRDFEWDVKRYVPIDTEATWDVEVTPWWHASAWRTRIKRRRRQAQGDLENWAVRHWLLLNRRPVEGMASTVEALVQRWAEEDPAGLAERLQGRPLRQRAWRDLLKTPVRHGVSTPARLVAHV